YPGLAILDQLTFDTSGVNQGDKNIQEIINTAISIGSLSAIVIIANGNEARITQSIKNTLILLSHNHNLPDELLGNLLLILSKCTKGNASFSVNDFSKEIVRSKATFHMDNRFFCTEPEVGNDNDERVDETITLDKMVNVNYHSTVCDNHLKNNIICHERCRLEMQTRHGTNNLVHCACMGQSIYPLHSNVNQQYQKYNTNNYQSAFLKLQAAATAKYELIHKLCKDLNKICSRFNFVDELHVNIENMKQDTRTIQNINIRKNAEAEIQRLEKLATDLSFKR
ncbi:14547_t:CDS:2, partial [Gigaspora rosea]